MSDRKIIQVCDLNISAQQACVTDFKKACKYHNRKGEVFSGNSLSCDGLCPHLFHRAYPYALALLYNSQFTDSSSRQLVIDCPSTINNVKLQVYRLKQGALGKRAINLLKKILVMFNIHCNPLEYRVFLKITSLADGCPCLHKPGQEFEFNSGNLAGLCPAAFDAIFAQLLKREDSAVVVCPDHIGNIKFILENKHG